ncbi:MAG: hypothetical protein IJ460_07125 [Clostridia bacterium]|nr:hypothetical protein [Clostridia bacterium]
MKVKRILAVILTAAMMLSSLTTAFAALPEAVENVITLNENVVLTETLNIMEDTTIDLNGYTITSDDVSGEGVQINTLIYVSGATLSIVDNGAVKGKIVGGTRTDTKSYNGSYYTIWVEGDGKLVVDGAVIEGSKGVNTKYGATAIYANSATVEIKNGSVIKGGDVEKRNVTEENYSNLYFKYDGVAGTAVYAYSSTLTIDDSEIYGGNGLATEGTPKAYFGSGVNQADSGSAVSLSRDDTSAVITGSVVKAGDSDAKNAANAISVTFGADLTVTNSTVTGGSSFGTTHGIAGAGIYTVHNDPEIVVSGSTVSGGNTDVSWIGSGIEISSNTAGATVEVSNSTVATGTGSGSGSDAYAIEAENADDGSVSLANSTLVSNVSSNDNVISSAFTSVMAEGTLTINGGTVSNVTVNTMGGVTIEGDTSSTPVEPVVVVAKIGNTLYNSVADAVNAAVAGDTIIVNSDIDTLFALPAPKVAPLTFKAARQGVKVTGRVLLPKTELSGTITYEGFDFSETADWSVYTWDGDEKLNCVSIVYKDCAFGKKPINIPYNDGNYHADWKLNKLVIDNCTLTDDSVGFYLQHVATVEIINSDFSNLDASKADLVANFTGIGAENIIVDNCNFGDAAIQLSWNLTDNANNVKITNTTFTGENAVKVSTDMTVADGQVGTLAFVGNTISSDTNIVAVEDESISMVNFLDSDVETIIFDNNTDESNNEIVDIAPGYTVAKIGDARYSTLDAAIAAANGAEIDAVTDVELNTKLSNGTINLDLNGNTLDVKVGSNYVIGNNIIKNGTVDISNASSSQNIFGLAQYNAAETVFTLENVTLTGNGYNAGYGVFEMGNADVVTTLNIKNSTINLENDKAYQGGLFKGYYKPNSVNVENTEITLDNADMIAMGVLINLKDSKIIAENFDHAAFRNVEGKIDNSIVYVDNAERGIKNDYASKALNLSIVNGSSVKMENSKETDLILGENNKITIDESSELLVGTSDFSEGSIVGQYVSKADALSVEFREYVSDEESVTYDIVVKGADAEVINRLNTVDLTFALNKTDGKNVTYEILEGNEDVTFNKVYNPETGAEIADRYEFHYEHKDTAALGTGKEITIGKVKISGYATFTFGVEEKDTNLITATTISDNIVEYFSGDSLIINTNTVIDDDLLGEISTTISIPTRRLVINVAFPNAIEANAKEYQDMKITVTGPDNYVEVIDLGNGTESENLQTAANGVVYYSTDFAESAEVEGLDLVLNTAYTVTVEGEGYRTVKYTVSMTEDKTLNFWNNVMDNDTYVEVAASGKKHAQKVTFLAGDIVKDNNINVYDLSAVVSYFGEIDLDENNKPEYAKYDLNRDGKIDSKDVAYVLVSWGN